MRELLPVSPEDVSSEIRALARRLIPRGIRNRIVAELWRRTAERALADPAYRAHGNRLAALKGVGAGRTCIVVGNGPSLGATDLELASRVDTFGLNRAYLLSETRDFTPTYHVVVNDLVISQFADELSRVPRPLFFPYQHARLLATHPNACGLVLRNTPGFSLDASRGVHPGATVTAVALQLAYHMGYARVLLVGVDHRFAAVGRAHEEVISREEDRNHFDPRYFGAGVRWNLPDLDASEESYRRARRAFEADGRSIVDCTVGGALTVFPRSPLERELEAAG